MKLINWECLKEMDKLIKQWVKVDAIITDPPYWTIKWIASTEWITHWMKWKNKWDTEVNPSDIFNRANKLLRKNWKLILFSQEPYTSKLIIEAISNIPFNYRIIWKKDHFANSLIAKKAPVIYTEDILVFSKSHNKHDFEWFHPLRLYFEKIISFVGLDKKSIVNKIWQRVDHTLRVNSSQFALCTEETYNLFIDYFDINKMDWFKSFNELFVINKGYRDDLIFKMNKEFPSVFNLPEWKKYKSNVLEYKKDYSWLHPTQKPVALMEDLVKTYTNEWETVLDFTMWSWTTWVACKNTNRDFIGIELDEKYFNIAKDRINESN